MPNYVYFLLAVAGLIVGYIIYGSIVAKIFGADENRPTPAKTMADGVDYVEMPMWKVWLIQLLNIAGVGPVFGPILGALYGPSALLWIVIGTIFAGAVHDYFSGMLSVRYKGANVPTIVGYNLGNVAKQVMRVFAVILLLPSCGNRNAKKGAETDAESTTLVKAGDTAPDFTVEMVDGSSVTLGDLKGKVVLLNFWATWCPPCRQELTRVQTDIIDRFAGKEFVFLPVSRGEKREAVEAFREKTGYAFPMGLDPARTVYDRYASNYIPRNFVIDRKGKVVLATVGYDEHEFEELIRTIEKTLGN